MAEWITPVFDRTQEDVDFAISKIAEWKKTGAFDVYELKGCLNISDINRIESNIDYLSKALSKVCYFPNTTSKTWDMGGLPNTEDIYRITNNVRKIISSFYPTPSEDKLPSTLLSYTDVNAIEENLYQLKEILDNMISLFRECGTFNCGEE